MDDRSAFKVKIEIERAMTAARKAKKAGDVPAMVAAWASAADAAGRIGDPKTIASVAWKASVACHEAGAHAEAMRAMAPALALDEPFQGLHDGVRTFEPIVRAAWDAHGYAGDLPARLWEAWARHEEARDEPWPALLAWAQVVWHHGCRAELDAVRRIVDRSRRMARTDAQLQPVSSLVARYAMLLASWCDDGAVAREAFDAWVYEDDEDELDALHEVLVVATRLGWDDVRERHAAKWKALLPEGSGDRQEHQEIVAVALQATWAGRWKEAASSWLAAAEAAEVGSHGPEWVAEGLVDAARASRRAGDEAAARRALARAADLVERYHVLAFAKPVTELGRGR